MNNIDQRRRTMEQLISALRLSAGNARLMRECIATEETMLAMVRTALKPFDTERGHKGLVLNAVGDDHLDLLILLVQLYGVDCINAKTNSGNNALYLAAGYGHWQVFNYLVVVSGERYMSDRNNDGFLPVHIAAQKSAAVLQTIFDKQGTLGLEARTLTGETPMHMAATAERADLVEWLIGHGCDCMIANNDHNTVAAVALMYNYPRILLTLYEQVGSAPLLYSDGMPILHMATEWGSMDCMRYIVELLGDSALGIVNRDRMNTAHVAALLNNFDVIKFIVQKRQFALFRMKNTYNQTPFEVALSARHAAMAKLLRALPRNLPGPPASDTDYLDEVE